MSTLTNDISVLESNFIDALYEVAVSVVALIVGIVVISGVMGKPIQKHNAQRSDLYTSYTIYIKEFLSAFHIIKSNNLSDKVKEDFYIKSRDIQEKGYLIDKLFSFIFAFQNTSIMIALYGVLAFSAYMAINGAITIGGVILIVSNMEKIMMPLNQLGEWLPKIFASKGLFVKIKNMLDKTEIYDETITINGFENVIDLDGISFSYGDQEVLANVNMTIGKGKKYLLIGPSGGGKSTLLKILRKYFNPVQGKVLFDGQNLKDITKASYFHQIANIEQQVFIFEDTIRNNLCLYKSYSDEEIQLAIKRAGLEDFVSHYEIGLDRMLYDNGKNISGGKRSRIAIARGLLQNAKIIMLDEAFASLDSTVAKSIENTLLNLEGITIVNVSHIVFEESKNMYDEVFMVKNKSVYAI